ncbi:universal stress protein [Lutibacter flavus]|uniref:Nucleotide-binding universal stress protein, UspA family n=1 Tax=Lutibacter flavus TaxID=691689 RepID=A0A238VF91_9FLAO|nr:universal stress protein [Lutibacter flavus]SNR32747.1 Nucleotide-binding universal stress protein, UspA family [Lutibacter flavus]
MKNILVPTDFSENSWNAIKYALEFFKDTPCNFYLLHVTLISNYAAGDSPIFPTDTLVEKTILKQAKSSLIKLLKKIKKLKANEKHNFYTLSNYNFFIDAVRNQIQEKDIDLIVMGTKGASGLSEVIVGSNTGDLITQVKCPVLIIPEEAVFTIPEEIAFPTDYNIFYQPNILKRISEITKMYDSAIRILHIAKKGEKLTEFQLENKDFLNDYFLDEKHSFHRITSKKIETGVQCFVESRNINLIIMIAKNLNLFQRILFKPTVEEISYHIEIPFLVLHE